MLHKIFRASILFILVFLIVGSVSAIENDIDNNLDSINELAENNESQSLSVSDDEVIESVYETSSGIDFEFDDDITVDYASDNVFDVNVYKDGYLQEGVVVLKEGNKELASGYSGDYVRMYGDKLSLGQHSGKLIYYTDWSYSKSLGSVPIKFEVVKPSAYFYKARTSAYYNSNSLFFFDLTPKNDNTGCIYVKCKVQVKNKGKWKTYYSNYGDPDFKAKGLTVGKHKVIVTCLDKNVDCKKLVTYIKIKKAKAKVTTTSTDKYFKFKVKSAGKALKKFKIKVKVFTGKKYKVKYVKTNRMGVAKLYVGNLKKNVYHKIKYSSANKNYFLESLGGTNTDYYISYSYSGNPPSWWLP